MRDKRLIGRIRSSDADTCAALVRAHYPAIYRMLAQLTRDVHAAEDLCQETFAAAWQKLDSFAGASSFRTWLHRIAYRKFVDWRRAAQTDIARRTTAARDRSKDPCSIATEDEETAALYAALDKLIDADREMLVLHYLNGLSYRHMAEVTGEPVGTIKWRTSAALERLAAQLKVNRIHNDARTANQTRSAAPRVAAAHDPAGA